MSTGSSSLRPFRNTPGSEFISIFNREPHGQCPLSADAERKDNVHHTPSTENDLLNILKFFRSYFVEKCDDEFERHEECYLCGWKLDLTYFQKKMTVTTERSPQLLDVKEDAKRIQVLYRKQNCIGALQSLVIYEVTRSFFEGYFGTSILGKVGHIFTLALMNGMISHAQMKLLSRKELPPTFSSRTSMLNVVTTTVTASIVSELFKSVGLAQIFENTTFKNFSMAGLLGHTVVGTIFTAFLPNSTELGCALSTRKKTVSATF